MDWIDLMGKITQLYLSGELNDNEFNLLTILIDEKIDNEKRSQL